MINAQMYLPNFYTSFYTVLGIELALLFGLSIVVILASVSQLIQIIANRFK